MILVVLGEHEWREGRGFDAVGRGVAPGTTRWGGASRWVFDAVGRGVAPGMMRWGGALCRAKEEGRETPHRVVPTNGARNSWYCCSCRHFKLKQFGFANENQKASSLCSAGSAALEGKRACRHQKTGGQTT